MLAVAFGILAGGCMGTFGAPPSEGTAQIVEPTFPVLRGRKVMVSILDQRRPADPQKSQRIVTETFARVTSSMERAGIQIAEKGEATIQISIVAYGVDFNLGHWNARAQFRIEVDVPGQARLDMPIDRLVTKANVWGSRDGDEALRQAYADAISGILAHIDEMRPRSALTQ
jgi:hypothetical protein